MEKVILKNMTQLIQSLYPPQYKEGENGFFLKKSRFLWVMAFLVLGFLSCDDNKPNRGFAPKVDNGSPIQASNQGSRKVVYLNRNTFKLVKKAGDTANVLLNKGVDSLVKTYLYKGLESDIIKVLEKNKVLFKNDFVDKIALDNALKEFEVVKTANPKLESFINFVDVITDVSKNSTDSISQDFDGELKPTGEQQKVAGTKEEDNSLFPWWMKLILFIAFIIIMLNIIKKIGIKRIKRFFTFKSKNENEGKEPQKTIDVSEKVLPDDTTQKDVQSSIAQLEREKAAARRFEEDNRLKKQLEKSEQKRIEVEREKAELEKEIERLKMGNQDKKVAELPKIKSKDKAEEIVKDDEIVEPTPIIEVAQYVKRIYLSLPTGEETFNNPNPPYLYEPIIGQSFYEFSISKDGLTATFKFWNNPDAIKYAIDKPHSHIEPACDCHEKSLYNSYATQIFTEKGDEGYAVLQDNKWIVKTKAKIKYLT